MEQRLEENNIKNENNRKKEYLRGYRSSRRRINRIDDEIIELKELAASVKAVDYSGMQHVSGNQKDLSDELARIDSLVEKLGAEKESCVESYVSIEKQIKEIKNEDENDVLFYRYVKGLRFWEIAEKMDMTPEEVKENMKIATKPVSMDAPLTTDEESISLYDVYIAPDPSIQAPESSLNQDSLKTDIERSFAALSVREATILSMYYGLNGYSSMSLEEIGTKLGLTSERVRQVKTKAIRKLKEVKNNKRLKTYL